MVSYNLREGLRPLGADTDRRSVSRGRADAARRLMADLDADVVVLNEALFCEPFDGVAIDYGALFGYPHAVTALYDREWGNAILARHPIVARSEMRIHNRGGVRATLDVAGDRVTVACYHPHPGRRPARKAIDFRRLLAPMRGPRVVCGDFNAVSPDDTVDVAALVDGFRRFSAEPEAAVARFVESGRAVFAMLASHGLRDAMPAEQRRYTMPTNLLTTHKTSAMRLDHIFVSDEIEVVDARVVQTELTEFISDHHPVVADLAVRRAEGEGDHDAS